MAFARTLFGVPPQLEECSAASEAIMRISDRTVLKYCSCCTLSSSPAQVPLAHWCNHSCLSEAPKPSRCLQAWLVSKRSWTSPLTKRAWWVSLLYHAVGACFFVIRIKSFSGVLSIPDSLRVWKGSLANWRAKREGEWWSLGVKLWSLTKWIKKTWCKFFFETAFAVWAIAVVMKDHK